MACSRPRIALPSCARLVVPQLCSGRLKAALGASKLSPRPMQVEYQLTLEDLVAFNWHYSSTSATARRRYWSNLAWAILAALVVVVLWPGWGGRARVLYLVPFSLVFLLIYPACYRRLVTLNSRKLYSEGQNKGVIGNHIIVIDAEGIREISAVGESRTSWEGVERIDQSDEYVFLYIGSVMAHVIPKRAFVGDHEATRFYEQAQSYLLGGAPLIRG